MNKARKIHYHCKHKGYAGIRDGMERSRVLEAISILGIEPLLIDYLLQDWVSIDACWLRHILYICVTSAWWACLGQDWPGTHSHPPGVELWPTSCWPELSHHRLEGYCTSNKKNYTQQTIKYLTRCEVCLRYFTKSLRAMVFMQMVYSTVVRGYS